MDHPELKDKCKGTGKGKCKQGAGTYSRQLFAAHVVGVPDGAMADDGLEFLDSQDGFHDVRATNLEELQVSESDLGGTSVSSPDWAT